MRHHDLNDPQDEDALAVTTLAKIRVFGLNVSGLPAADALDADLMRLAAEDHGIAFAFYIKDEQDFNQAQIFLEESTELYDLTLNADAEQSADEALGMIEADDTPLVDVALDDDVTVTLYSAPAHKYNLIDTATDVLLEAGVWEEAEEEGNDTVTDEEVPEEDDGEFADADSDPDELPTASNEDAAQVEGDEEDDEETDDGVFAGTIDFDTLSEEDLLDLALSEGIVSDDEVDELTTSGLSEDRRAELISELHDLDETASGDEDDDFDMDDPSDDGRLIKRVFKQVNVGASLTVVDVIPSIVLNLVIPSVTEFEKNEVEVLKSYENRDFSLPIRRAAQKRASGSLIGPLMYVIDEMDSLIQRSAYVQSGLESQFTNMLRNSLASS
jgi:hypothetical protein